MNENDLLNNCIKEALNSHKRGMEEGIRIFNFYVSEKLKQEEFCREINDMKFEDVINKLITEFLNTLTTNN